MSPINHAIAEELMTEKKFAEKSECEYDAIIKVYHSETKCEMEVNADLMGVDLCNPYVLMFLAKETTYHHAFWPHTAKRFTAFKNVLRHNKAVRKSLRDTKFLSMIADYYKRHKLLCEYDRVRDTIGRRLELKNIKQVVDIVEKAIVDEA